VWGDDEASSAPRQARLPQEIALALLTAVLFSSGGCSDPGSDTGAGSNTVACRIDSDCGHGGCVNGRCTQRVDASVWVGAGGLSGGGAGGRAASGSGAGGIATAAGDAGAGATGTCVFPPPAADGALDRPGSPPYATCYGCHPTLHIPDEYNPVGALPFCVGTRGEAFEPRDLPCGACSQPGYRCGLSIKALCDCDGAGPRSPVLDNYYSDGWICACVGGNWKCWMAAVTGSSCSLCNVDSGR
jgi:hypothetical protein